MRKGTSSFCFYYSTDMSVGITRLLRFAKSSDRFSLLGLLSFSALDSFLSAFFPRLMPARPFPPSLAASPSVRRLYWTFLLSQTFMHQNAQDSILGLLFSFLLISYRACIRSFHLFICYATGHAGS